MRTRTGTIGRRPTWWAFALLLAIGVALVTVQLATAERPSGPSSEPRLPASDADRLSDVRVGDPPGAVAIDRDQALRIARDLYDPERAGATSVDAYLETISVPATYRGDDPIRDRPVWIVRLGGLAQVQGGPMTEDGTPARGRVLTVAYVFIDAKTGEFLYTEFQE